ncbi:MAG: antitoxin [Acidimicrobiia bacterium]
MSKIRLQVIVEESELRDIRRIAKRNGLTVSAWVRQVLRQARQNAPATDEGRKLAVIAAGFRHDLPTADIGQVLGEIESGYSSPS